MGQLVDIRLADWVSLAHVPDAELKTFPAATQAPLKLDFHGKVCMRVCVCGGGAFRKK